MRECDSWSALVGYEVVPCGNVEARELAGLVKHCCAPRCSCVAASV